MRTKAIGLAVLAPLLVGALPSSPVAGASRPVRPSPAPAAAAPDPEVLARVRPAVVRIVALVEVADEPGAPRLGTSSGSGFVITSGGLVVTNHHVVAGADGPVDVYLEGREKPVEGDVVGASECSDLAVVRIPARGLPKPLDWASEPTRPGDGILAMGYPAGQPRLVVTEGVVQGGTGPVPGRWADVGLAITHSAHTVHGDSGGPLVDADTGAVVGVGYAGNEDAGVSWAIAAPEAAAAAALISTRRGPMSAGLHGEATMPEGDAPGRVLVTAVDMGSLAYQAGIVAGDVITRLDGAAPTDDGTMHAWCSRIGDGIDGPVPIEVVRGGVTLTGELKGSPLTAPPGVVVHGWSPPQQVVSGRVFSPLLLNTGNGDRVIVWSAGTRDGLPGIRVSRRTERGWTSQRVTTGVDVSPWATLDSRGRLAIVFSRHNGSASTGIYMATERGAGWRVTRVSKGRDEAPVVRVDGSRTHVAFVREGRGVVYTTRQGSGRWSTRTFRGSPDAVALRLDDRGAAHLAWTKGKTLTYASNRSGTWQTHVWDAKQTLGNPALTIGSNRVPILAMRYGRYMAIARIRLRTSAPSTAGFTSVFRSEGRSSGRLFGDPRLVSFAGSQAVTWTGIAPGGGGGVWLSRRQDGEWLVEHVTRDPLDTSPAILSVADGLSLAYARGREGLWFTEWRP